MNSKNWLCFKNWSKRLNHYCQHLLFQKPGQNFIFANPFQLFGKIRPQKANIFLASADRKLANDNIFILVVSQASINNSNSFFTHIPIMCNVFVTYKFLSLAEQTLTIHADTIIKIFYFDNTHIIIYHS